jgi:hypothetical protein
MRHRSGWSLAVVAAAAVTLVLASCGGGTTSGTRSATHDAYPATPSLTADPATPTPAGSSLSAGLTGVQVQLAAISRDPALARTKALISDAKALRDLNRQADEVIAGINRTGKQKPADCVLLTKLHASAISLAPQMQAKLNGLPAEVAAVRNSLPAVSERLTQAQRDVDALSRSPDAQGNLDVQNKLQTFRTSSSALHMTVQDGQTAMARVLGQYQRLASPLPNLTQAAARAVRYCAATPARA